MAKTESKREVKTRVDNCVLYSDGSLRIDGVRGSYLHLDEPWGGKPFRDKTTGEMVTPKKKYQGKFWMPVAPEFVPARKLIVARVNECMAEAKIESLASEMKFIRKGSDLGKPELKDFYVISASEENPPALRGIDGTKLTDSVKVRKLMYSGAWYSVLIRPWGQNNDWGKRINAGLSAVRRMKTPAGMPDDNFGGQREMDDDEVDDTFSDIEAGEDDDLDDTDGGGFDDDDDL